MARRRRATKLAKLLANERLRDYVQDRLPGTIARPEAELVAGPDVRFIGRRHGRRADRPVGEVVEPGADLEPTPGRLPR